MLNQGWPPLPGVVPSSGAEGPGKKFVWCRNKHSAALPVGAAVQMSGVAADHDGGPIPAKLVEETTSGRMIGLVAEGQPLIPVDGVFLAQTYGYHNAARIYRISGDINPGDELHTDDEAGSAGGLVLGSFLGMSPLAIYLDAAITSGNGQFHTGKRVFIRPNDSGR
jgi:hypothetical protein